MICFKLFGTLLLFSIVNIELSSGQETKPLLGFNFGIGGRPNRERYTQKPKYSVEAKLLYKVLGALEDLTLIGAENHKSILEIKQNVAAQQEKSQKSMKEMKSMIAYNQDSINGIQANEIVQTEKSEKDLKELKSILAESQKAINEVKTKAMHQTEICIKGIKEVKSMVDDNQKTIDAIRSHRLFATPKYQKTFGGGGRANGGLGGHGGHGGHDAHLTGQGAGIRY